MTGGEPPLPPSRNPYPPWHGRPYRRRGGGPAPARNGWVGRRPRSPPPPPRPRHPRGAPHRHHRHLSQQHSSSQSHSHSHQSPYHHHGPPQLSRNLQGRLRSPPRSPPPRRSDIPLHRDEPLRSDPHRPDRDRLDQHRPDPLRPDSLRGDQHRPDSLRGEQHFGDAGRGEQHRGDQHPGELHRPDQHRGDHPYRGEPGPPHRIDPPDRGPYRGGEPYAPPRGLPTKPRGEPGPFRSEQRSHRGSGDHHVPYRGEPGPLYRADFSSHHDDMDPRRGPSEGAPSRGDSQQSYSPWFRHPSKIHKPVKRKMRRHTPHISGLSRPLQLSKPESPILSRVGFPPAERGSASSRTDALLSSSLSSSKPSSSFPNVSSKWHMEPSPRFNTTSPRSFERDSVRRFERGARLQGLSGSSALPMKKPTTSSRERSRSPDGDSFSARSGGVAGRGSVISKSPVSEERAILPPKTPPDEFCNGRNDESLEGKRHGGESGDHAGVLPMSRRLLEKVSCNAKSTLNSTRSQDQRGHQCLESIPLKTAKESTAIPGGAPKSDSNIVSSKDAVAEGENDNVKRAPLVPARRESPLPKRSGLETQSVIARSRLPAHNAEHSLDGKSDHILVEAQKKSLPCVSVQSGSFGARMVSSVGALSVAPSSSTADARLSTSTSEREPRLKEEVLQEHGSSLSHAEHCETRSKPIPQISISVETKNQASTTNASHAIEKRNEVTAPSFPGPVETNIRSAILPGSPQSPPKPPEFPLVPAPTSSDPTLMPGRHEVPRAERPSHSASTSHPLFQAKNSKPERFGSVKPVSAALESAQFVKESNEPRSTVSPGQPAPAPSSVRKAPALPNLNLRSILSSVLPSSSPEVPGSITPTTPIPQLRSLLRPVTPAAAKSSLADAPATPKLEGIPSSSLAMETPAIPTTPIPQLRSLLRPVTTAVAESSPAEDPVTPKVELRSSPKAEVILSARGTLPIARSPVSVPAPAISFLRSSPMSRGRGTAVDVTVSALNSIGMNKSPAPVTEIAEKTELEGARRVTDLLVEQIHETEKRISELERRLAQQRALEAPKSESQESKNEMEVVGVSVQDEQVQNISLLTRTNAAQADGGRPRVTKVSLDPMHAALRLVMVRNQAKAAAASAALRPMCDDPEIGLYKNPDPLYAPFGQLSEGVLTRVASEVAVRKSAALERKKWLSREYSTLRESWIRKLKSARDKKSKEKREAIKERDRFLVLRTKGHSALLTSRTSSGRMSTKIFPSLNTNGQMNGGTAEVDALLAEIAAEGGTPGSKKIWSKTLADIPDQDASLVPCDNGSVLVEDPLADFNACRWINPWQFEEKLVFLEKFVVYSKNFRKIASFLEYKSTRECCQFYYMNKLDLGLKQLAKESSTLKRKGILKSHLVSLAKKRLCFETSESIRAHTEAFLSSQNLVNGSGYEKGLSLEAPADVEGNGTTLMNDKKQMQPMKMMLKKRIMAEYLPLDTLDIDFDKFSQAVATHGADWKEVASTMAVPGMSSTHYRELYRRNRRRLRFDDEVKLPERKLTALSRSATPSLRQSPRNTPRSSPNPSPSPPLRRLSRGFDARELESLMLDDAVDIEIVGLNSTTHGKSASPSASPTPRSSGDLEYGRLTEAERRGGVENEGRKNKTTSWTSEEGERFRRLFKRYGRDWKKIAQSMSPKTPTQVKGYWRKIAHEVGNGLSSDAVRSSNGEKKRPRRSSSADGFVKGGLDVERRISPEKHPSSGQSGMAPSEPGQRDAKRARNERDQEGDDEDTSQDLGRTSPEDKDRNADSSLQAKERRDCGNLNGDLGSGSSGQEQEREKNVSDEEGHWKKADGHGVPNSKLPMLRSAPLPMFRSVPVGRNVGEGTRVGSALSQDLVVGGSNRSSDEGPRQVELRKAAESYGVLELLGSRLEDASSAQRGKR